MKTILVDLDNRSYTISVEPGICKKIGDICTGLRQKEAIYKKIVIITNPSINSLYGKRVIDSLDKSKFECCLICVPEGEISKSLAELERICQKLAGLNADRRTTLIALGGGVIGDLTGFAAASYMRGVPFIQVPTTLLAMVDSSVGGKTGVNLPRGKNLIGAFYQPRAVVIDPDMLETLPKDELQAGLAEVIKYAIIKDYDFFTFCEEKIEPALALDKEVIQKMIITSCLIKAQVVELDEKENRYRAILNFGHTIGHAIESLTLYKKYKHGEAVAIGMVYAALLSCEEGYITRNDVTRIKNLLKRAGLPITPPKLDSDNIIECLTHDKKAVEGRVTFVLLKNIGTTFLNDAIPFSTLKKVWNNFT